MFRKPYKLAVLHKKWPVSTLFTKTIPPSTNFFAKQNYSTSFLLRNNIDSFVSTDKKGTLGREILFDPSNFPQYSKEELYSLLCTPTIYGGVGLSKEDINQLFELGFLGIDIDNISSSIVKFGLKSTLELIGNKSGIIIKIAFWVDDLLKTKFYHLWNAKQLKVKLLESTEKGGAGLSTKQVKPFRQWNGKQLETFHKSNNKIEMLNNLGIPWTREIESTVQAIEKWISTLTIRIRSKIYEPYPVELDNTSIYKYLPIPRSPQLHFKELLFLGDLNQMQLTSLEEPLRTDAFVFDLKNRDETINKVINDIATYYAGYHKQLNKHNIPFIIASGGSGSGKSRMLELKSQIVQNIDKLDDVFKRTRIIYFNFTNGFNIDLERQVDKYFVTMITSRIIFASFANSEGFARTIPIEGDNNMKLLFEVLYIISKKLHERANIDMSIPIPIVLAFDEFQHATRRLPEFGTNIQHLFSWYIRQLQKQHGLIIIPTFGGTITESDIKIEPTDHATNRVDVLLPCLREQDIESIITKYDELIPYYTNRSKIVWNVIGSVPRHLELAISYALNLIKSQKDISIDTFMSTVYIHVATKVLNLYSKSIPYDLHIIALIYLSGLPKTMFDRFQPNHSQILEFLEQKGLLYSKNERLQLPLIVLDQLLEPKYANVLQNLVMSKKQEWEKLEELCLQTLICRFELFFNVYRSVVYFEDLFTGVIFPSALRSVIVRVNNNTFAYKEIDHSLSHTNYIDSVFYKTKKGEMDWFSCNMEFDFGSTKQKVIMLTQSKLEDTTEALYGPADIAQFYTCALNHTLQGEKYVLLVTNKRISNDTKQMIEKGVIEYTESTQLKVLKCPNLLVIDRDCLPNFFNSFIAEFLTTFKQE